MAPVLPTPRRSGEPALVARGNPAEAAMRQASGALARAMRTGEVWNDRRNPLSQRYEALDTTDEERLP